MNLESYNSMILRREEPFFMSMCAPFRCMQHNLILVGEDHIKNQTRERDDSVESRSDLVSTEQFSPTGLSELSRPSVLVSTLVARFMRKMRQV